MLEEVKSEQEYLDVVADTRQPIVVYDLLDNRIFVKVEDLPKIIASNYSKDITVVDVFWDTLFCDTHGCFINNFGSACRNQNEFRNELAQLQMSGIGEDDFVAKFAYCDKKYPWEDEE